ncbi:MAG: pyruvate, phosphate dikinase [Caldiserica bacterium]|jgi:pyruvate,orthophosphate dikinase|nr:pyruvate, phosphate dikinase [Caldisericota bacterium]MDH7561926.1 pyruvate, phosphate dikinase [Caldisericota bacterium]
MPKRVYDFHEGTGKMKDLLGGKGAGLAEMSRIGLPVPPGFTITTEACLEFQAKGGKDIDPQLWEEVLEHLKKLEEKAGKKFGSVENPLLVSVRSGAPISMPGMMDTVLNLGLNDQTVEGLARLTGNPRFAYDSYRRFLTMFGNVVLGIPHDKFEHILEQFKGKYGVKLDTELSTEALKEIVEAIKKMVKEELKMDFPQDPLEQLKLAVKAVFLSWNNERAIAYRKFNKIPETLGTAVNVQMMVFGNMGSDSGTGVAFTRNPATGEKVVFGEYLLNAQGEDVVAGIRTPKPISAMKDELPQTYQQFMETCALLEKHFRDIQDIEFTVERGKLYLLQTRSGKRTARAAVKVAVDMVREGLISKEEAVMRVEPNQIYQLLLPHFDENDKKEAVKRGDYLAKGVNASPGAATGKAVFDPDTAEEMGKRGEAVILVRAETSPDDVHGMIMAKGILTARGGATSHAAVVARSIGKPCVTGCEAIKVDLEGRSFSANGIKIKEGDYISIDGATGEVFRGKIKTEETKFSEEKELQTILSWADEFRKLQVWANADYPRDAQKAREFGAQGIGLCRTEHMFFEEERLPIVRKMILASSEEERKEALDQLLPIQKEDFKGIFRAMDGLPVVIRLLDPPLHEFLPSYEELLVEVTRLRIEGKDPKELEEKEKLLKAVEGMREMNPMLGLRGCRLGLVFPAINEMQTRAILTAAIEVSKEGVTALPEIMIPLVGHVNELKVVRDQLEKVAEEITKESGVKVNYKFGTMIEVPRACLTADQIASVADFFSFGTNDLTQMTFAYSRDDAEGKFLFSYLEKGILKENPFQVLDREGVGKLVKMAVEQGRSTNPSLKVGICGEHGGEPSSIEFCHLVGLNYVSCSPFRVPIARLSAAQAALKEKMGKMEKIGEA